MKKFNVRILSLLSLTLLLILLIAFLYQRGMASLEQRPRTYLESLEFVIQTMTTVGYGQDAPWHSPLMQLLVMFTEVTGIALVLISIPVIMGPWLKERLQARTPTRYTGPRNHVILSGTTTVIESLMDLFSDNDIPHVLIESNDEVARDLYRRGRTVMHGDPERVEVLEQARFRDARLMILDGTDQFAATVALVVQEEEPDLRVVGLSENRKRFDHLLSAGIDKLFYPQELIGTTLAHKVLAAVGKHVDVEPEVKDHLEIKEFPVFTSSSLIGQTLRQAELRQETGTYIIGIWREGQFHSSPDPDFRIREHDILVAAGTRANLERLSEQTEIQSTSIRDKDPNVLIVGYGNEGQKAEETLRQHGITPFVIDSEREHVDLVGNGMDPDVLRQANIEEASFLLVTVSDDEVAIMVTLIARKLNPSIEILTQVNDESSVESMYRAGANYVQALDRVCSRLIAEEAMDGDLLTYRMNVTIQKVDAGEIAGQTLKDMGDGSEESLIVLAVKRKDTMHTELPPDFRVREGDHLFVVGTEEEVDRFRTLAE